MTIFQASDLQELSHFQHRQEPLAVAKRLAPEGAGAYFKKVMQTPLRIIGQVSKASSIEDIRYILEDELPDELQDDPFYALWVLDMAQACETFCNTLGSEAVGFCLTTERGCRRYHIDNIPLRLLVTYAGQGTEWLPDEAADRSALRNGAPNEEIVKDPSARKFISSWDVAIFRGGPKGLLHRTPDDALNAPSILMRLDHQSFWDNILKQKQASTSYNAAA